MQLVKRILVATDFSPTADDALKTAAAVAKHFNSEVILLHVIPDAMGASSSEPSLVQEKVSARLQERAEQLRAEGIETIETQACQGTAFDQIDRQANEHDVNVIVIGAGNVSEGGQFYLGTTAGRLRRKATKPVWIVRPDASPEIDNILCPIDFSEASGRALKNAIHLARGFHAKLTVLTVIQSTASYDDEPIDPDPAVEFQDATVQTRLREMDSFLRSFDFHEVDWNQVVRRGKPYREILRLATEGNSKLLVMGSVGRTGVARIFIGGVARRVAQRMPCSIITVRSEEPIRLSLESKVHKVNANFCASRKPETRCTRYEHGTELLERGFPEEALVHFQDCVAEYSLCPRAWENLATAHDRLGHKVASKKCRERAERLDQILASNEIEADIRENHVLFRTIFGA